MFKLVLSTLIACLVIIIMCSFFSSKPSEKRKLAYKIASEVSTTYEKKYGLKLGGISEAAPEGKYQNLGMELYTSRKLSKSEGRKILLEIEKDFLKEINSNIEMEKFLLNPPFTGCNVVINIYVNIKNEPDLFYPDYSVFSIFSDNLYYGFYKKKSNDGISNMQFDTETKEEAIKHINHSN